MTNEVSTTILTAVFLGAVLLFGVPALVLCFTLFAGVVDLAVTEGYVQSDGTGEQVGFLASFGLAVVVGLQIAYEAAALQLHGVGALYRGPEWQVILRHLLLASSVALVLGTATWIGLSVVFESDGLLPAVLGGLLGIAGIVVLLRSSWAIYSGLQSEVDG